MNLLWAQCPALDITFSKETVCLNENFNVAVSPNNLSYLWDFCPGSITEEAPSALQVASLVDSDRSLGTVLVEDEAGWYGFATSRDNNSIIRFFFGAGVEQPPTSVINLGNIQSLFNQPASIQVFKRNGVWYGLVHNWADKNIVLLTHIGEW